MRSTLTDRCIKPDLARPDTGAAWPASAHPPWPPGARAVFGFRCQVGGRLPGCLNLYRDVPDRARDDQPGRRPRLGRGGRPGRSSSMPVGRSGRCAGGIRSERGPHRSASWCTGDRHQWRSSWGSSWLQRGASAAYASPPIGWSPTSPRTSWPGELESSTRDRATREKPMKPRSGLDRSIASARRSSCPESHCWPRRWWSWRTRWSTISTSSSS